MSEATMVRTVLAEGLVLGEPRTAGALTLMPVSGTWPGTPYRTAEAAFADGTLIVGELGGGTVPALVVRNTGRLPVLLLDGEHLLGAMQDRVLNVSVLVPPQADTAIPVSCVERGRWEARSASFSPSEDHAHAALRALKAESASVANRQARRAQVDQSAVWAHVDETRLRLGTSASATGALTDATRDRRSEREQIVSALGPPAPWQTGVLAVAAGRVLALDVFDRPATLASVWERLVRGYAVDTLGLAPSTMDEQAGAAFLARLGACDHEVTVHDGVGLGIDVVLTSDEVVANALTWEGAVVHLAAFPRVETSRAPRGGRRPASTSRIERPANRARAREARWFHQGDGDR